MAKIIKKPTREELLEHARAQYNRLFTDYDNPNRALGIWFAYLPEIFQMDLLNRARGIAEEVRTARELDSKLELLVSESKFRAVAVDSAIGRTHSGGDTATEEPILNVQNRWYSDGDV